MKKVIFTIGFAFCLLGSLLAQTDSLQTQIVGRLMGQRQTGNLNSIAVSPSLGFTLSKKSFKTDLQTSYQYLQVGGFTLVSDFWVDALHQHRVHKRLYPMVSAIYGFAKSYQIKTSLHLSAGLGLNVRRKSPMNYLQVHAFAGYLNFEFEGAPTHSAAALGSAIRGAFPLSKTALLLWNVKSFHSLADTDFWGANNQVMLRYQISPALGLNISHNTVFNNQPFADIKRLNTVMMFGVDFKYNK